MKATAGLMMNNGNRQQHSSNGLTMNNGRQQQANTGWPAVFLSEYGQETRNSNCVCEKGEGVGHRSWLDRRIKDPKEGSEVFTSLEERTKATPAPLQEPR